MILSISMGRTCLQFHRISHSASHQLSHLSSEHFPHLRVPLLSLSLSFDKNFDKSHLVHFAGIGYILDPDFSFVKVAAPYAQVCVITNLFLSTLNSLYSGSSVSIS